MVVNQKSITSLRVITDIIVLNLVFVFAAALAQPWEIFVSKPYLIILMLLESFLWIIGGNLYKLYSDFQNRLLSVQATNVFKNVFTQIVFAIFFLFFVKEFLFTRWFILFYGTLLFVFILLKEFFLKSVIYYIRKKKNNFRNLIILGKGETAGRFRDFLEENNNIGYKLKAVLDDEKYFESDEKDYNSLENYLLEKKIDDVILSLPLNKFHLAEDVIKLCDRNAVQSYIVPDDFRFLSNKFNISLFGDIPVITTRSNPMEEVQWRIIKRIFDLTFSLLLFVLILWWLLPMLALIIRLDSEGKALFVQKRVGKNNREFNCYKFRTMEIVNEESNKPVMQEDDRLTGIGRFLRKYNLDELPQFLNVIKGDMSLVGPRPHAIPFDITYSEIVEEIKLRHRVKPGITGWAQIHGLRGDVFDFEQNKIRTRKRIQYDIWYIENWTFWLDLQIMFRTVWQILSGKNLGV